jgi:hypothetical protein
MIKNLMRYTIKNSNISEKKLFDRVVSILEDAHNNVVHSVNLNMVLAYWLIGKLIIEEIQDENNRAGYGNQVLEALSIELNKHYGSVFSVSNLKNFRQFYLMYSNRINAIRYPLGSELLKRINGQSLNEISRKSYPSGSECLNGFSPQLSWSHYRALMRVNNEKARLFYEHESITCGWDEAVARYSILNERKQIFASKYMPYLPAENELKIELERERKLIEEHMKFFTQSDDNKKFVGD